MTDKHIKQIASQLPEDEKIERMYRAFEGDVRVITRNTAGREIRYTCMYSPADDSVKIRRF